jgi:hypothetical protein
MGAEQSVKDKTFVVCGKHRSTVTANFRESLDAKKKLMPEQIPSDALAGLTKMAEQVIVQIQEVFKQHGSECFDDLRSDAKQMNDPMVTNIVSFITTQEGIELLVALSADQVDGSLLQKRDAKIQEIILSTWAETRVKTLGMLDQFEKNHTTEDLAEMCRADMGSYGKCIGRLDPGTFDNVQLVFLSSDATVYADQYSHTIVVTEVELARLKALPEAKLIPEFLDGVVLPRDTPVEPKKQTDSGDNTLYEFVQEPTEQKGLRPVAWIGEDGTPEYAGDVDPQTREMMERMAKVLNPVAWIGEDGTPEYAGDVDAWI